SRLGARARVAGVRHQALPGARLRAGGQVRRRDVPGEIELHRRREDAEGRASPRAAAHGEGLRRDHRAGREVGEGRAQDQTGDGGVRGGRVHQPPGAAGRRGGEDVPVLRDGGSGRVEGGGRTAVLVLRPGGVSFYAGFATTHTLICAATSRATLMSTVNWPTARMGGSRWIFLRSTSMPWARSASSLSREVTEPNS